MQRLYIACTVDQKPIRFRDFSSTRNPFPRAKLFSLHERGQETGRASAQALPSGQADLPPATDTALERLADTLDTTKSELADVGINTVIKAHRRRKGFKRGPEEDTVFVYFRLENEKRAELEAIATTRGCTIDELVSLAVTEFLASQGAQ